jgi:hypothetical protein
MTKMMNSSPVEPREWKDYASTSTEAFFAAVKKWEAEHPDIVAACAAACQADARAACAAAAAAP